MTALKLVALDDEDLSIVSAHVQDAVLKVGDMNILPRGQAFRAAMNRFVWEGEIRLQPSAVERRQACCISSACSAPRPPASTATSRPRCCRCWPSAFETGEAPAGTSSWSLPAAARSRSMSNASRRGLPISAAPGKPSLRAPQHARMA